MSTTIELLQAHLDALVSEKKALLATTAPLKAEREKLVNQMEALRPRIVELTDKINAMHGEKIVQLSSEITRVHKAMGGKSLSD